MVKVTISDLARALEWLKGAECPDEFVIIDERPGHEVSIKASDLESRPVTIRLFDTESSNKFAEITRSERL